MSRLVDWAEVYRDARHVVKHVEDGRKLLQSLEVGAAVLAASSEWPKIKDEWEGLIEGIREFLSDFR